MRKVRRKSADAEVRRYLLKAADEGVCLSWDRYEKMQPQDGFAALGLSCFDCLMGPCRINPFARQEEKTICALTGEQLAYRSLWNLMGVGCAGGVAESGREAETLAAMATEKIESLFSEECRPERKETRQVGLGVLKEDHVNVCLEDVSWDATGRLLELAGKKADYAESKGAKGFNIVLAGDVLPMCPCNIVSDAGGVEFALLTGLVDLYAAGVDSIARGKNVVPYYHTAFERTGDDITDARLESMLISAAAAYVKRDAKKILSSSQLSNLVISPVDGDKIKEKLEKGEYKGICILGGGANVKFTQDKLLCEAADRLKAEGVICLVCGNAAVVLAKHGMLEEGSGIIAAGGSGSITHIIALAKSMLKFKIAAFYPELSGRIDLLSVFALAGAGVKALSSTHLPLPRRGEFSDKVGSMVEYCGTEDAVEILLKQFSV